TPMIMKTVRLRPPGLAGAAGSSGDNGEGRADRGALSRSIVVAMSSLIAWVRKWPRARARGPLMKGTGDAGGARQGDPGGGSGEPGVDLGGARANQNNMRGDDVEVDGQPGIETVTGLAEVVLGGSQL